MTDKKFETFMFARQMRLDRPSVSVEVSECSPLSVSIEIIIKRAEIFRALNKAKRKELMALEAKSVKVI